MNLALASVAQLSIVLCTERLPVRFPVRVPIQVVCSIPSQGAYQGAYGKQTIDVSHIIVSKISKTQRSLAAHNLSLNLH